MDVSRLAGADFTVEGSASGGAPGVPGMPTVTLSGQFVTLKWAAPVSGGPVIDYQLEAGSAPGARRHQHRSNSSTDALGDGAAGHLLRACPRSQRGGTWTRIARSRHRCYCAERSLAARALPPCLQSCLLSLCLSNS